MTRTEIITRLCEIAAELAELSELAHDADVKRGINDLEQCVQNSLHELQQES